MREWKLDNENIKTYVLDGVEVTPTGKTAMRKTRSGKEDLIHEVTPKESISGIWKKWVSLASLYEVVK